MSCGEVFSVAASSSELSLQAWEDASNACCERIALCIQQADESNRVKDINACNTENGSRLPKLSGILFLYAHYMHTTAMQHRTIQYTG